MGHALLSKAQAASTEDTAAAKGQDESQRIVVELKLLFFEKPSPTMLIKESFADVQTTANGKESSMSMFVRFSFCAVRISA